MLTLPVSRSGGKNLWTKGRKSYRKLFFVKEPSDDCQKQLSWKLIQLRLNMDPHKTWDPCFLFLFFCAKQQNAVH